MLLLNSTSIKIERDGEDRASAVIEQTGFLFRASAWLQTEKNLVSNGTEWESDMRRLTSHVAALNVVLDLLDLLLELINGDLVILDDEGELDHVDAVADRNLLGRAPDEAVLLNGTDLLLHSIEVRLVIPGLDLERDDRLGNGLALHLLLLGTLPVVLGNALGLDTLRLGVLLLVGAKEVDVVIVVVRCGGSSGSGGGDSRALSRADRERKSG